MPNLLSTNPNIGLTLVIVLGLFTGTVSGLLGIGGAVVVIPILVFMFGFDQHLAQGTTLAMMLPPVTFLAVMQYHKAGHINWKIALLLSAGFFIGGLLGSKIATNIDASTLKRIFGIMLLIISLKMIFSN